MRIVYTEDALADLETAHTFISQKWPDILDMFDRRLGEMIYRHLYAYGLKAHLDVQPSLSSIHEFFDPSTRTLFDRCFASTGASSRVSAQEWRDHFKTIINNNGLFRCARNPNDHQHFSRGCGLCDVERRLGSRAPTSSPAPKPTPVQLTPASLASLPTARKTF